MIHFTLSKFTTITLYLDQSWFVTIFSSKSWIVNKFVSSYIHEWVYISRRHISARRKAHKSWEICTHSNQIKLVCTNTVNNVQEIDIVLLSYLQVTTKSLKLYFWGTNKVYLFTWFEKIVFLWSGLCSLKSSHTSWHFILFIEQ